MKQAASCAVSLAFWQASLVAGAGINNFAQIPGPGRAAGRVQLLFRGPEGQLCRVAPAVQTLDIEAPASLLLQKTRPAAQGTVLQFNFIHRVM